MRITPQHAPLRNLRVPMLSNLCFRAVLLMTVVAILDVSLSLPAAAASSCVNPANPACYTTIGAAVAAATPGDTINVAHGTYKEQVTLSNSISLVGENRNNTTIDATGLVNGIYINGTASAPNAGVTDVTVTGFTIENAQTEGILVANASNVTISNNDVTNNDLSLIAAVPSCTENYDFETNESFDCGEGIHLTGVDHSIVSGNISENNAGGILLSDDTGATHDNLITGNVAKNNPYDCGITLASHPPATITNVTSGVSLGVFHNTITGNQSSGNGLAVFGAGAGVGLFAGGPGNQTYGNIVINNILTGNGLPGVAMHNHASAPGGPAVNLNDNVIVGNQIGGNHADTQDAATPGSTGINLYSVVPVTGTVISQNAVLQEKIAIAVNIPAPVELHLNNLLAHGIGVDNLGTGAVNATENWWGCSGGPTAPGCSSAGGSVIFTPWLTKPAP